MKGRREDEMPNCSEANVQEPCRTGQCKGNALMMCYLRIPKNVRETIKKMTIPVTTVLDMEDQILGAFAEEPVASGKRLEFRGQDPFERFLLHCVCKFYGCDSRTLGETEDCRRIVVERREQSEPFVVPQEYLAHFLVH